MAENPKPVRRIVVKDENDKSRCIADGPAPDVRLDPARPGFASTRIWLTRQTPALISEVTDPTSGPHTLEPPSGGSLCRVVTFPPDTAWKGKVGAREVQAYFGAMGSPGASTYSPKAPHPYMQKTRTLDLCLILEGEITLVLDTEEVHLKAGDTVVQRGTNHAWSNRSSKPCVIAFSLHDAAG
ncbi:MAG TPA: cupin domain-containing protein [Burkholderiales bacterium]|nr:cupin domain-containing protein [Burkholderiales bacterium]